MTFWQAFILGAVQGIAEWLPVSSQGLLVLAQFHFWSADLESAVELALFLHLGTFFAALVYFRKEVARLFKALFDFNRQDQETQNLLLFLIVATLISGGLGIVLLRFIIYFVSFLDLATKSINLLIAILLLGTGILLLKAKAKGTRTLKDLGKKDWIVLGLAQAFAALPGFSRSGLTVSVLLLRKYGEDLALRFSFLLSLPIVLAGNILLNLKIKNFQVPYLIALFSSFVFGILTIDVLIKSSRKVNFGYLVLFFSGWLFLSVWI